MTRSMGSGERKRCSNMAPVRRLRSLAWMEARKFPGVRCSTLKTKCSSLLCLMTIPGRICVAGIAIKEKLLQFLTELMKQDPQESIVFPSLPGEDSGKEVADAMKETVLMSRLGLCRGCLRNLSRRRLRGLRRGGSRVRGAGGRWGWLVWNRASA